MDTVNCVYCGSETQLRINGAPVCIACAKDIEAGRKPPHRESPKPPPKSNQAF
jgi:hypothetical protein